MIRLARAEDAARWLDIRNDLEARFWSGGHPPITDSAHAEWFAHALTNPREHLVVLEESNNLYGVKQQPGRVIGYGRLQEVGLVSVAIEEGARGHGLGGAVLLELETVARNAGLPHVLAVIHPSNMRSMRAFMRAGYHTHPINECVVQRRVG